MVLDCFRCHHDHRRYRQQKEINQKVGYLPTDLTGVVRCDLEKPVVNAGITTYGSTYLYYENYKLKSAI